MTNKDYTLKVEKQVFDDGSYEYVASYFEVKDIIGVGDTVQEAISELEEAKKAFIYSLEMNGEPLPIANCEIKYSGRTTVRMSKRLHKQAFEYAQSEGISLNQLIVDSINSYVTGEETRREVIFKDFLESNQKNREMMECQKNSILEFKS